MKKNLSVLIIILLALSIPASFAQEFTVADKAKQKSIEVVIDTT